MSVEAATGALVLFGVGGFIGQAAGTNPLTKNLSLGNRPHGALLDGILSRKKYSTNCASQEGFLKNEVTHVNE